MVKSNKLKSRNYRRSSNGPAVGNADRVAAADNNLQRANQPPPPEAEQPPPPEAEQPPPPEAAQPPPPAQEPPGTPPAAQEAPPQRRSTRPRSGGRSDNNGGGGDADDIPPVVVLRRRGDVPEILRLPRGDFKSDVHRIEISGIYTSAQRQQVFDIMEGRINQTPLVGQQLANNVDLTDGSSLPTYQPSSVVIKYALLVHIDDKIYGFLFLWSLPHPRADHIPPKNHYSPPVQVDSGSAKPKTYTGLGSCGIISPYHLSNNVKRELTAALGGLDFIPVNGIIVTGLDKTGELVKGLMERKERIIAANGVNHDPYQVFTNLKSFWIVREKLIEAVHGNLSRYHESSHGGCGRFMPPRDLLVNTTRHPWQRFPPLASFLDESIDDDSNEPLLRGNPTMGSYTARETEATHYRENWLIDQNQYHRRVAGKFVMGCIDQIRFTADVTRRVYLDAGVNGGKLEYTITVRNDAVQYPTWTHVTFDDDNWDFSGLGGGHPPLNPSFERWNELKRRGVFPFVLKPGAFEDTPEDNALGLKYSLIWINRKLLDRFGNNHPFVAASGEPNSDGNEDGWGEDTHVQFIMTFHSPDGRNVPDGFIAYVNSLVWWVGCQPKTSAGHSLLSSPTYGHGNFLKTMVPLNYDDLASALLYLQKNQIRHNTSLSFYDRRRHHSLTNIGIQPSGLMFIYLPHMKPDYARFFGQVHLNMSNTGNQMYAHYVRFPPNIPGGNFHEPQEEQVKIGGTKREMIRLSKDESRNKRLVGNRISNNQIRGYAT